MTTLAIPCALRNLQLLRRKLAGPYGPRYSALHQAILVHRASAMLSQSIAGHRAHQGA